jgi:hypothetical protein
MPLRMPATYRFCAAMACWKRRITSGVKKEPPSSNRMLTSLNDLSGALTVAAQSGAERFEISPVPSLRSTSGPDGARLWRWAAAGWR